MFACGSFVRSVSMDKWKDLELEKMKVGGNRRAKEFFLSQPDFHEGMSLQEKYNSKAAALYRDKVFVLLLLFCRLLLCGAVLHSWAVSLHSHVILHEWSNFL